MHSLNGLIENIDNERIIYSKNTCAVKMYFIISMSKRFQNIHPTCGFVRALSGTQHWARVCWRSCFSN